MDYETTKELCILIVFGILLPSFDVYSDIKFSIILFYGSQYIFGSLTLIPIALTTIFMIPKWWKREKTPKQKLFTFPLLAGQLWPQWEALKIVRLIWNDYGIWMWREEKKKLELEISSLGI